MSILVGSIRVTSVLYKHIYQNTTTNTGQPCKQCQDTSLPMLMEQGPKPVNIHIICDSRGAGLGKTLPNITKDFNFTVTIRSRATFDVLSDIAVAHKENFDNRIVVGSLCSITTKEVRYVSYMINEARKSRLKDQISTLLDTLGTRMSIATIPPAIISKYNAHKHHP